MHLSDQVPNTEALNLLAGKTNEHIEERSIEKNLVATRGMSFGMFWTLDSLSVLLPFCYTVSKHSSIVVPPFMKLQSTTCCFYVFQHVRPDVVIHSIHTIPVCPLEFSFPQM